MKYPNNIKKTNNKFVSYANRGMNLEELINQSNDYYLDIDKAVIYKKPTPIQISEMSYINGNREITHAYFKSPSTLDYNGLYKGRYIDFDAKETKNKTSFPLQNLHDHQYKHIKNVIKHGGIAFLIIYMNNEVYYLDGKNIINFIENTTRKSIPFKFIEENGYIIERKIKPRLDYLKIIDKLYFKGE